MQLALEKRKDSLPPLVCTQQAYEEMENFTWTGIFFKNAPYSDLPNRRIVVLNETMVKFCPIAKRDDPIN